MAETSETKPQTPAKKTTPTRPYVVCEEFTSEGGADVRETLVDATSAAAACRHAARRFSAKAASPSKVAELMGRGVRLEKAGG